MARRNQGTGRMKLQYKSRWSHITQEFALVLTNAFHAKHYISAIDTLI